MGEGALIVHVILHSILRELLPREARGRIDLELPAGSTLADVRERLRLPETCVLALNGHIQRDLAGELHDGDEVRCFRPSGGG